MLKLLGLLLLIGLGASGMSAWDRHPQIGWHARVLWLHPGFDLPDSLATSRDKALHALQIAQDGEKRCRTAIGAQNASIAAQSAKSTAALAKSAHDVEATRPVSDRYRRASAELSAHKPAGNDDLARWLDADRAVVGSLR